MNQVPIFDSSGGLQLNKEKATDVSIKGKILVIAVFLIMIAAIFAMKLVVNGKLDWYLGIYGSLMVCYLILKMGLAFFYAPYDTEVIPDYKVTVIVPSYNESEEAALKTVLSILKQDYPIHEIFFIDDGSKNDTAYHAVKELSVKYPIIKAHRLEKNSGKRHAQIWAFKQATGDLYFTVDSDGYVYPNAVRELVKPMIEPEVMAVTGHINARNREENLFTRLIDMRYDNAFRVERAAQSVTDNVLVCSGPITLYRREVIMDNLDRYANQMFLGQPVQFGDDRCLTNFAIERGKTLYQSTAKCITDVPNTLRSFLKQQIRWNKSFYRENLLAFKAAAKKPLTLVWVMLETSLWITFTLSILFILTFKLMVFGFLLCLYYLAYIFLSAYARNVFYIVKHPIVFILAPVYGLIHLFLLFPLRIYALFTIKSNGWGTR